MSRTRGSVMIAALALALLGFVPRNAGAADYVIGVEDVLQISVWMHPELERSVTVNTDGIIVFPPIGEIKAAGMTSKQLSEKLGDRLSTYLRQTATVTVTVSQFLSHSVTVSGAVGRPGRYGSDKVPGLIDVLQQAGGASANADLSRVQVLRRENGQLRTLPADVAKAMQDGTEVGLPTLQVGDVVVVPAAGPGGGVTADASAVLGEVQRPGLYAVGTGQDLWMLLGQAGGPTSRGDLASIQVMTQGGPNSSVVTVDLDETLNKGNRAPYIVKPGDVVYLYSRPSYWGAFLQFLSVTTQVVGLVGIVYSINHH